MKKIFRAAALGAALFSLLLLPCFSLAEETAPFSPQPLYAADQIDLDLSRMSDTVIYAQIYHMIREPETYRGKIIRIAGWYDVFRNPLTEEVYFSCIVPDATACCAQGVEFVWAGEHRYPDDYPDPGTGVTVTGRFETYMEDDWMYIHLLDADVEFQWPQQED